jgi:hypothetical protein
MRLERLRGVALWAAAVLAVASGARAQTPVPEEQPGAEQVSDEAELARVTSLYEAGQYGECAKQLATLLDPKHSEHFTDPAVIETARVYDAACLIGSGHPDAADDPLRRAIRANPQMRAPDSLVFPPEVVDRFIRVRETLLKEIRKAEDDRIEKAKAEAAKAHAAELERQKRIARLKQLASQETVTTTNRRWIAAIPFGVGQFQNRENGLGWAFLSSEVVLGGTAFGAMVLRSYYQQQAFDAGKSSSLNVRDPNAYTVLVVTGWAFVGVAVTGIVQAQLAFVPEFKETRERPLPKELESARRVRVLPALVPATGGLSFGVTGTF